MTYPPILFITGIGTDVGKTYATGWLARTMMDEGLDVITQKFVQTGCNGFSEDIATHRKLMRIKPSSMDLDRTTAPQIFSYPASADLAARLDGKEFDFAAVNAATRRLTFVYDHVLIEGAGGLMVPLRGTFTTLDYLQEMNYPVAVVTNGQLGSISHTLLTLYALAHAGVKVWGVIYNHYFDKDATICADTIDYLRRWLAERHPDAVFLEMI
ncbi:MAG: dethiobiotin synthase [Muribaculaceae bacterium]|nr:dethiobiotin synthase [Muribaculaceae bacterium]